jgi:hypothetical protein
MAREHAIGQEKQFLPGYLFFGINFTACKVNNL